MGNDMAIISYFLGKVWSKLRGALYLIVLTRWPFNSNIDSGILMLIYTPCNKAVRIFIKQEVIVY